jgi:stalled ribosome rescue protein Dom34
MPKHVAVWIDHKEARVLRVEVSPVEEVTVEPTHHVHNPHPRGPEEAKEHPEDAKRYFHAVAAALEGAEEILVVGPASAKLEFLKYVHKHAAALEPKIVGIETVDHPTDGQLVAYAKQSFKRRDRML